MTILGEEGWLRKEFLREEPVESLMETFVLVLLVLGLNGGGVSQSFPSTLDKKHSRRIEDHSWWKINKYLIQN